MPSSISLKSRLERFLGDYERALGGRNFFAGDFSIADLALYPVIVQRWPDSGMHAAFPNLVAWARRVSGMPNVTAALPLPDAQAAARASSLSGLSAPIAELRLRNGVCTSGEHGAAEQAWMPWRVVAVAGSQDAFVLSVGFLRGQR